MRPPANITSDDLLFVHREQAQLGISPSSSSQGSSSGITIDPVSLAKLNSHFDGLLLAISSKIDQLTSQTKESTQQQAYRANAMVDYAAREMDQLTEIMRQCDELNTEMLKIQRVGEMVKGFRARIEALELRHNRR
ncbi:hypothetical protein BJ508DRAFT_212071 [Ascobolus immersus RN42]|uniref:Biogenesis of lysosome-related organelles complex 1 subunit CNL1 n=1 Tax=Ascobolus immersus RN42 TaxID=1160509 RepID=A0A3N4I110_ASCIM|nr:hypothetical protein BJ508DRAFT_212071 [Ascobolus immersus RN42]